MDRGVHWDLVGETGAHWTRALRSRRFLEAKEAQPTTDESVETLIKRILSSRFEDPLAGAPPTVTYTITLEGFGFPYGGFGTTARETVSVETLSRAQEMTELRQRVSALEEEVSQLRSALEGVRERVLVLRTLTREEARGEIVRLFQEGGVHDYGEIAERLQLDLALVVDICNELEGEGLIGGDA